MSGHHWRERTPDGRSYRVTLAPPGSGLDVGEADAWTPTGLRATLDRLLPVDLAATLVRAIAAVWRSTGPRWRVVVACEEPTVSFRRPRPHREELDYERAARERVEEIRLRISRGSGL